MLLCCGFSVLITGASIINSFLLTSECALLLTSGFFTGFNRNIEEEVKKI